MHGLRHLVRGDGDTVHARVLAALPEDVDSAVVAPFRFELDDSCLDGVVFADHVRDGWMPSSEDMSALTLVVEHLERVVLRRRRQRQADGRISQLTRLYELSSAPALSLDPEKVLVLSLAAMVELTGAERGFIFLLEGDDLRCRVAQDRRGQPIAEADTEVSWSIVKEVLSAGAAVKVDDAMSDRVLSSHASIVDLQLLSVMCVPIRYEGKMLGVAYVDHRSKVARFSADDLRVFDMFGPQIAGALDKALDHAELQEASRRKTESVKTLEQEIEHHTRELRRQTELAIEANRLKSEFLANMSHEIRTPMNSILGFSELLRNSPLSSRQEEFARFIHASASNLLEIINDILDLSKIESGKMLIERCDYSPIALGEDVVTMVEPRAEVKNLNVRMTVRSGVPETTHGDPVRVRQILLNLMANAVKFTSQGSVMLEIRPALLPPDVEAVEFAVTDTGIGIAPDKQRLIFDPFAQADGSTARTHGGTGLGLTITRNLIELIGGAIALESVEGLGTTFTVTLPVCFGTEVDGGDSSKSGALQRGSSMVLEQIDGRRDQRDMTREVTGRPEGGDVAAAQGPRILVVDDNAFNVKLAEYYLAELGVNAIVTATDGRECLARLADSAFDLVLLDMQMPVMDGYETVQEIRKDARLSALPVVALTANAMSGTAERCIALGCSSYVSKPFDMENIRSVLAEFLPADRRQGIELRPRGSSGANPSPRSAA